MNNNELRKTNTNKKKRVNPKTRYNCFLLVPTNNAKSSDIRTFCFVRRGLSSGRPKGTVRLRLGACKCEPYRVLTLRPVTFDVILYVSTVVKASKDKLKYKNE